MSARTRGSTGVRDGSVPPSLLARRRRPRVSALLDLALRPTTRLTLVSAPPGYGKSVAVAGWAADGGLDCAWIELDAEGRDPTVLATRLLGALEPFRPGAERARTLAGGGGIDARGLAALVRRSVESDDRELVMVLDDVHAADSPDGALFVGALLQRMPPFGHLVLVTREDPQLPLARLRAHAELVEVRADDLRFSADEGHAFLADLGLEVDTSVGDGLIAATEGWPAALQLAALAARSRPEVASIASARSRPEAANIASAHSRPPAAKVLPASNRYLVDYLADEVMAALDPDTSAAIERLAVADRFSVGLAEALTGRPDTAALLDRLERDNLFLVALDAERRWFRLHALFAAYLRDRLSSEARADLQRAATRWFVREGMPRDAIRHALAGDDPMAIDLIRAEGRGALEAGELRTLAGWLDGLGPATVAADVELAALDAWSRFYTGDLAGSGAAVDRALAGTPTTSARGRLLVLGGLLGTTTDAGAEAMALEGVDLVGEDWLFRSLGLQAAGLARLARGELEPALVILREAFDAATSAGLPMAVLPAVNPLGHALEATGRRDEAEQVARRVLDDYRGQAGRLPIAWSAELVLGIALYEGGNVGEARLELERGVAHADELGIGRPVLGWALPAIAFARQATGDSEGALAILDERGAVAPAIPSLVDESRARVQLAQGDLAKAARWADEAGPQAPPGSPLFDMLRASREATVARIRLAQARPRDALSALERARADVERWRLVPDLVSIHLLSARARLALGDTPAPGRTSPKPSGSRAPRGYVRRFVDDGAGLDGLLPARAEAEREADAFLAAVRAARREAEARRGAGIATSRGTTVFVAPNGELVESLTPRERDVLRLMARGATNAEIGQALDVSAGTAKWHVAHVLAKLGARSRTQAVITGQAVGFL